MIPAVDSYCYHRLFGRLRPGEADPGRRVTFEEFLDEIVVHGARGVSLESFFFSDFGDAAMAKLREILDARDLPRVWAWGHPRGLESGRNTEALDDLVKHIDVAAKIGAPVMRICAGGRGTRPDTWKEHREMVLPMLMRAAEAAAAKGVVLAVENHIDLYADELLELMETVNSPALGVCLDTANNLRLLEDPVETARKLAPWARATHIKDVASNKGDPRSATFWPSVPLGTGAVDIEAILKLLQGAAYRGLLAIEIDLLHPAYTSDEEALRLSLSNMHSMLENVVPRQH